MDIFNLFLLCTLIAACSAECSESGWDFHDLQDISGENIKTVISSDRNGCQIPCLTTPNCVAYSWSNGNCYLKRDSTTIVPSDGVYSAILCKNQPCTIWGWRFYDFTLISGTEITQVASSHRNGCQAPCESTPGCVVYSWSNGLCSLKSEALSFTESSDVYSAISCKATSTCGDGKIRGVNLGGWLLLEPWMTPSIFSKFNVGSIAGKVYDEWTVAQYVDRNVAKEVLENHWDTFYQPSDLQILFNSGISHVRIPVGYWIVDVQSDEPFPPPPATDDDGQRFYLKRLMKWAEQIGLKVLLDLHGAPGSQNGYDHSGHSGSVNWLNNGNVERTIEVIGKLANLMEQWINEGSIKAETLYGIELLNEPAGSVWDTCKNSFYPDGYHKIRDNYFLSLPEDKRPFVTIMSGFKPISEFYNYMSEPDFHRVSLDQHLYQCFDQYWNDMASKPEGWDTHLKHSCDVHGEISTSTLPTFTGEFSLSVIDCRLSTPEACAYYSKPFYQYSDDYKEFLRNYFLAQIDAFEYGPNGVGWFFWNAKIENDGSEPWNFLFLLKNGIIPTDLCNRNHYCQF